MRSQGFASPCGYGFSGTRLSIQQHAALGASRQELVHSSRVVKLYMAVPRHASTSGTRSSRARVRPRSEHAAGTQRRTVLLPVGASGALPSFLDTRLASSVMAGDDHMEQLSLVQQRGMAATRAAVRSHGHGTSNGSLGGKGGRAGKHERRHQQRAQRGGERGRSSSGAATVSSPATATHQEEVSSLSTCVLFVGCLSRRESSSSTAGCVCSGLLPSCVHAQVCRPFKTSTAVITHIPARQIRCTDFRNPAVTYVTDGATTPTDERVLVALSRVYEDARL